jgi:heat-inducible transcriptional repressor
VPELRECSLVTATYSLGDHTHGTIGVIGPTRMEYGRVLNTLSAMGEQLTRLFSRDRDKE